MNPRTSQLYAVVCGTDISEAFQTILVMSGTAEASDRAQIIRQTNFNYQYYLDKGVL